MQVLKDIFGHCIIPKNTLLFRGHGDISFNDSMFFTTKKWVAGAFNDEIQIWKTTTDIEVLFLVEYLNSNSWTASSLPQLYNIVFPGERNANFDDLDIKHWSKNRRNKLVRKLFDNYKISGWLTSIENKVEMEVCLFDKHKNEQQLIMLDTINRKDKKYFKDSLDRIRILPSKNFYQQTKNKFSEGVHILTDKKDPYKKYKRMMNSWILDEVKNGMDKIEAKHYHFNLRTKLKI